MKSQPTTKKETHHGQPSCRKCDSTDIEFTYTENHGGDEIDEESALSGACYYIGEAIEDAITGDWDAATLADMGKTLSRLAHMLRVRQEEDKKTRANAEAQS